MDQTSAGVHKTDRRARDICRLDHVSFLQVQSPAKTLRIVVVDSELCAIRDHTQTQNEPGRLPGVLRRTRWKDEAFHLPTLDSVLGHW
jgi:hypothetical protein